jgi:uncharacterized protein
MMTGTSPQHHRFQSNAGQHVLVVPYSRIYDLPLDFAERLDAGEHEALAMIAALGLPGAHEMPLDATVTPTPHSISLNVSSSCNLGCGYCYASQGRFGGSQPEPMTFETARASIECLFADRDSTAPLTIGFLGGEPFVNRTLIHRAVAHASMLGRQLGRQVGFSVTTNATLLNDDDIKLLRAHRFAVTVSIDGGEAVHDAQRPLARGRAPGSFRRLTQAIGPLLKDPGLAKIAARATVLPGVCDLEDRFKDIIGVGFTDVGFSPLRTAPTVPGFDDREWDRYLRSLVALSRSELERAMAGRPIRLANLAIALKQLHRGAASPYACGAGGGYFSVAANGEWYACHRAIGNPEYRLGDSRGLDEPARRRFLSARTVHAKADCNRCWARYLCSGGCHQEAAVRTAASCDFIRAWLDFCLTAYCDLSIGQPAFFDRDTNAA